MRDRDRDQNALVVTRRRGRRRLGCRSILRDVTGILLNDSLWDLGHRQYLRGDIRIRNMSGINTSTMA